MEASDPSQLAQDFKKDELQAAAAVQGVEVPSGATKADIAEAIVQAQPVVKAPGKHVDQTNRRTDDDALEGSFVQVLEGEHAGQVGSFVQVVEYGADGYPESVLVRFKDPSYTHYQVTEPYSNVRTVRGY